MKNADVILFYPSSGESFKDSFSPPHSLLSIASELVEEYNVKIIDQRTDRDWKNKLNNYLKGNPICVAFSVMTSPQISSALDVARIIRNNFKSIELIWGGVHPSMLPDETLNNGFVDIIVRGEGEYTFKKLINAIKKEKGFKEIDGISYKKDGENIHNKNSPFVDVNELKPTPWELVNAENYIGDGGFMFDGNVKRMMDIGVTSRGCCHSCAFCYNLFFNQRKWRGMTAKKTFEMIKETAHKFNLDGVWLHDDNYFVDLKRVSDVADLIMENIGIQWTNSGMTISEYKRMDFKLREKIINSGCNSFRFGVETANPRIIKLINKPNTRKDIFDVNKSIKKHNVSPIYSFMIGFPTETKEEIMDTCKAIARLKKENKRSKFHSLSIYTPYPATPLFDLAVKNGFEPPTDLEGWSKIYWGSKEMKVSLSEVSREYLDNIQDISYLNSDWFKYVLPEWLNLSIKPVKIWLGFRWKHQLFSFAPELKLYRKLYKFVKKGS